MDENLCYTPLDELREIGKRIGVHSPTTYSKKELIEKINSKIDARPLPSEITQNKIFSMETEFLKRITREDKIALLENNRQPELVGQEFVGLFSPLEEDGFIRVSRYNRSPDDIFIPQGLVNKYGIRKGDVVVGVCRNIDKLSIRGAYKIELVNGYRGKYERKTFPVSCPIYPTETIKSKHNSFNKKLASIVAPIGKGQRALIVCDNDKNAIDYMSSLAVELNTNRDIFVISLFIGIKPEDVTRLKVFNMGETSFSTFNDSIYDAFGLELALNRAMRMVEAGRNVVIILANLSMFLENYPNYNYKNLLASAANFEEGGSLTIITSIDKNCEKYFSVLRCANSVLYLNDKTFAGDSFIDIYKSHTDRSELMQSVSQNLVQKNFKKMVIKYGEATMLEFLDKNDYRIILDKLIRGEL